MKPKTLILIFLLALFVRNEWRVIAQPTPASDFYTYHALAEGLIDDGYFGINGKINTYRLPGWPLVLAIAMGHSRSIVWLAVFCALLSAGLAPLVCILTRTLSQDDRVALVAGCLVALNPAFIFFAPVLASEHLNSLLVVGAFALLFGPHRRGPWLGALLLSAAVLVRGESLFYAPAYVLFVAWPMPKHWRQGLVVVAILSLFPALWIIRNYRVTGRVVLADAGKSMIWLGHGQPKYGWHGSMHTHTGVRCNKAKARLKAHPTLIFGDIWKGTKGLYGLRWYASRWALVKAGPEGTKPYKLRKPLLGVEIWQHIENRGFVSLCFMATLGFIAAPWRVRRFCLALIASNWVCYAVVAWGASRYRYIAEIAMIILAAQFMAGLLSSSHRVTSAKEV